MSKITVAFSLQIRYTVWESNTGPSARRPVGRKRSSFEKNAPDPLASHRGRVPAGHSGRRGAADAPHRLTRGTCRVPRRPVHLNECNLCDGSRRPRHVHQLDGLRPARDPHAHPARRSRLHDLHHADVHAARQTPRPL